MSKLRICLFGKFHVSRDEKPLEGLDAAKAQELFCYLLLHWSRPHSREILAGLLWGDSTTAQSRKYLRQGLWQLQSALETNTDHDYTPILHVEPEWVQFNLSANIAVDVMQFVSTFELLQERNGSALSHECADALRTATELYRGDLLEGWCQDWCLFERERLQNIYLIMLDKLISYCEAHSEYESGLAYSTRILQIDRAHERTHQQLMRLRYLLGDRTGALRQYERCVAALADELAVEPSAQTRLLYEQIRADHLADNSPQPADAKSLTTAIDPSILDLLSRLKQLWAKLGNVQREIEQDIQRVELSLHNGR